MLRKEDATDLVSFSTLLITNLVSAGSIRKSILCNIPEGTEKLNLIAVKRGYDHGKRLLKEKETSGN